MAESVVPVEILGQRYPIRGAVDAEYIQKLVAFLDDKLRAAANTTAESDPARVTVVAALNLADEVFRLRAQGDERVADVSARLADLERLVDAALAE